MYVWHTLDPSYPLPRYWRGKSCVKDLRTLESIVLCSVHYNCLRTHTFVDKSPCGSSVSFVALFVELYSDHDVNETTERMPFQAESNHRFGRLVPIHSVDNARSRTWTVLWDDWGISEVGASRDRWCSRKSWCDIEGEGIKKWKEALIVLKNNLLYVYKNETVPDLLLAHGSRQNPLRCWSAWISAWSWYF